MPTYQYACTECDHAFDQVQSFSDDSLTVCPECQGRLRKVFNAVGVVFKGSGFYRTDSRSSDTSSTSGSDSSKKESKTESTSTPKTGDSSSSGTSTPASAPAKTSGSSQSSSTGASSS